MDQAPPACRCRTRQGRDASRIARSALRPELITAYASCRSIAKREAKNFYYGFLALPAPKRDAMCAIYAFMRRADDISDDESVSLEARRTIMRRWLNSWHTGQNVLPQDEPVFLAVQDVQSRFRVSNDLLAQLVEGTTMDLDVEPPPGVCRLVVAGRTIDQYETVSALEHYCYLVASVVGLTTIRIFGATDASADAYAVQLGLAFQFTNILRDVREDAERGRVYLPAERMAAHSLVTADIVLATGNPGSNLRLLLGELGARAETLYAAASKLIPLLDPDSRAAMRVLVDIYHLLLKRIVAEGYDVFSRRVRVSTSRKLIVLAKGLLLSRFASLG